MDVAKRAAVEPLNLQLWFGNIQVADLKDVIVHQGTWFGQYAKVASEAQGLREERLCEFIAFCKRWHERLVRGDNPDAAEFDPFADIVKSKAWRVVGSNGDERKLSEAPVFVEGEASWHYPESERSPESVPGANKPFGGT